MIILALLAWAGHFAAGLALVFAALVPLSDMTTILAARGSTARACGVHGLTAMLMLLGGALLAWGV